MALQVERAGRPFTRAHGSNLDVGNHAFAMSAADDASPRAHRARLPGRDADLRVAVAGRERDVGTEQDLLESAGPARPLALNQGRERLLRGCVERFQADAAAPIVPVSAEHERPIRDEDRIESSEGTRPDRKARGQIGPQHCDFLAGDFHPLRARTIQAGSTVGQQAAGTLALHHRRQWRSHVEEVADWRKKHSPVAERHPRVDFVRVKRVARRPQIHSDLSSRFRQAGPDAGRDAPRDDRGDLAAAHVEGDVSVTDQIPRNHRQARSQEIAGAFEFDAGGRRAGAQRRGLRLNDARVDRLERRQGGDKKTACPSGKRHRTHAFHGPWYRPAGCLPSRRGSSGDQRHLRTGGP